MTACSLVKNHKHDTKYRSCTSIEYTQELEIQRACTKKQLTVPYDSHHFHQTIQ